MPHNKITPQQEQAILDAHGKGLTDSAIASRLRLSARTVANYRRAHSLPTNAPNLRTALYGEHLVVEQGRQMGLPTIHMAAQHRDHPYDVLVGGWRVEVKVVHDSRLPDVFRFSLSPTRKGKYADPRQVKDYARDCDFLVLVCKSKGGKPPQVFVMTPAEAGEYVRIDLNNLGTYSSYQNAWHRLAPPVAEAA
ncbi:hypothetical protein L1280_000346 [Deinococcus sp. HSC-46F16]|uniref:hypothetical protein n=1 Tax=Deinococcus sp. HSC-46F16 TaxID=2910968 RepID=UPI00209C9342|nr:hypothetical protein [Deinococcus sp. HSC-46F16]MCP2013218.1 hypothetical protein [Deinococcus sp. HSC-46F16]